VLEKLTLVLLLPLDSGSDGLRSERSLWKQGVKAAFGGIEGAEFGAEEVALAHAEIGHLGSERSPILALRVGRKRGGRGVGAGTGPSNWR